MYTHDMTWTGEERRQKLKSEPQDKNLSESTAILKYRIYGWTIVIKYDTTVHIGISVWQNCHV